ncbi:MAG: UPF0262 family protein [Magnetospirillum sp. WYHS-4]
MAPDQRLSRLTLDAHGVVRFSPRVEHERRIAIQDLLDENSFQPVDGVSGPFVLHLGLAEGRLLFDVRDESETPLFAFPLSLAPLRGIIKDYFMVCDSYYKAIGDATPSRIEAIDMGRRGLHNEGAEMLRDRLAPRIAIDTVTARRLFTLICVMHIRS